MNAALTRKFTSVPLKESNIKSILRGKRTSFTRKLEHQPSGFEIVVPGRAGLTIGMDPALDGGIWYIADGINPGIPIQCPFGEPGDTIRFKERFRVLSKTKTHARIQYLADMSIQTKLIRSELSEYFVVDNIIDRFSMPFWATRIQAVITSVDVIKRTSVKNDPYAWRVHFHVISTGN